jgi:hypothetical protein
MTLFIAWSCNPGSRVFVVGVKDLEHLGHCQKSGCRNSPDQVDYHEGGEADHGVIRDHPPRDNPAKKYPPPPPRQKQRASPPVLLAEFASIFGALAVALHIRDHGVSSVRSGLDRFCLSTRRALVGAAGGALSSGKSGNVVRVASAGVRGRFVSTVSAASLGSLVDLIGNSDHSAMLDDSDRGVAPDAGEGGGAAPTPGR